MSPEPVPTTMRTARGVLEQVVAGDGPAVLALHGAMGGWDQSLLLARTIGEPAYRTVALSRPGYLGTPLASGRSPEAQADLYAAALDALGIMTGSGSRPWRPRTAWTPPSPPIVPPGSASPWSRRSGS